VRSSANLLPGIVLALLPSLAAAQSSLGELLDTGGTRLSTQEFRDEVVQRILVGLTPTGGIIEIMYATNGSIQGLGSDMAAGSQPIGSSVNGNWTIDDNDRICTAMTMSRSIYASAGMPNVVLPSRCQYWFKLDGGYFISDSDWDRRAKVIRRSIKPTSQAVVMLGDLGQVLDAGAKKLSTAEFKRDIAQHSVLGNLPDGTPVALLYAADGSIDATLRGGYPFNTTVSGGWTFDDADRVCTTLEIRQFNAPRSVVPRLCQFWFKLGDVYFVSDSDSDRRAKVLTRTVK
jgi:hypothetical protein